MQTKFNLLEKFNQFNDHWNPRVIGALNGQLVKIARFKGEFIWHKHDNEDELFYVVTGKLIMDFRDRTEILEPGDMIIVPSNTEHRPRVEEETLVMMFEPSTTLNTGNIQDEEYTKKDLEEI